MTTNKKYILYLGAIAVITVAGIALLKRRKRIRAVEAEQLEGKSEVSDNGVSIKENYLPTIAQSQHFAIHEFACNDANGSPVPNIYMGNVQELMENLEVLRHACGDRPVTVISAFRTPLHNASVGGKSGSYHLPAMAADIKVEGLTPTEVYHEIEKLIAEGKMKQGGLGRYPTFTHYDIRGTRARW